MHPQVRDLYKRFMVIGADYPHPEGLAYVKRKVKDAFWSKAHLTDEVKRVIIVKCSCCTTIPLPCCQNFTFLHTEKLRLSTHPHTRLQKDILKAVGHGRYVCRETLAFMQFKKYRRVLLVRQSHFLSSMQVLYMRAWRLAGPFQKGLGMHVPCARHCNKYNLCAPLTCTMHRGVQHSLTVHLQLIGVIVRRVLCIISESSH